MPNEAGLFLEAVVKQHEPVSIFALTQKKDHFSSSIVVIIAGIQKIHKGANSPRITASGNEIPRVRQRIIRIVHISAVSCVEAGLNKKRIVI